MINHGTRSGYYAHRRMGDPPCNDCREAINEYIREYRSRTGLSRNRAGEKMRRRALAALRERHREEYEDILDELRAEEEE
jgi:hypothetical protein